MSQIDKNKNDKIEITEMFMAQASENKCFYGIIKRSKDAYGNPHLFSRIVINDGLIQACSNDQKVLGKMLDELCVMYLDKRIHKNAGVYIIVNNEKCFMN